LKDYDGKRARAVQSLVLPLPALAVPFLTGMLGSVDLALGMKLVVLEWLTSAAAGLSQVSLPGAGAGAGAGALVGGGRGGSTGAESTAGLRSSAAVTATAGASSGSNSNSNSNSKGSGKVTIKRPATLAKAAASNRVTYFRNNFGPVQHLFFLPLLALLGRLHRNEVASSFEAASTTREADRFNLIEELFEEPKGTSKTKEASTTSGAGDSSSKSSGSGNSSLLLEHLEGTDALLPAQCLVALGQFCQCAVNTLSQR
jgi:hypothetical protein